MKQFLMAVLLMVGCSGLWGCAASLPPHEALNDALKKSFESNGFNYTSTSRIAELTVSSGIQQQKESGVQTPLPLQIANRGLALLNSFQARVDGAVDLTTRRSEVLYGLRFSRNNLDVSVKIPLYADYTARTIYVGPSVIQSALAIAYPQLTDIENKTIRIDVNNLIKDKALQENTAAKEILRITGAENFDSMYRAMGSSLVSTIGKQQDSLFSDQQLTREDTDLGIKRKVRVQMGHEDALAMLREFFDQFMTSMHHEGLLGAEEYDVISKLISKETANGGTDVFTLGARVDTGVGSTGYINRVDSTITVADKQGELRLTLEHSLTINNYNACQFTMKPEQLPQMDLAEIMAAFTSSKSDTISPADAIPDTNTPEELLDVPEPATRY